MQMGGPCDPSDSHDGHHHRRLNGGTASPIDSSMFDEDDIDPMLHRNGDVESSIATESLDFALNSSSVKNTSRSNPPIDDAIRARNGHDGALVMHNGSNKNGECTESTSIIPVSSSEESASAPALATVATATNLSLLQPPQGRLERFRDSIFQALDLTIMQKIGAVVLLLVIADGALFFFLLMGWQRMCRPRRDCEPRNELYNVSIQFLNILFTYTALIATPWRVANFLHLTGLSCPHRSNALGCNLYGQPHDADIWFYISRPKRLGITVILLFNALFQFINHGTRIVHYNYEMQDTYPGNIWTSVFFAASFLCAGIGASWLLVESSKVRKVHPNKFPPGPIDMLKEYWKNAKNAESEKRQRRQEGSTDVANETFEVNGGSTVVMAALPDVAVRENGHSCVENAINQRSHGK